MRPLFEGYTLADGGRVSVLASERERLEALGLDRLESALGVGTTLRATPYKAIARLDDAAGSIYVKRYDYDRRTVFLKALVKANFPVFSGPRELENALALRAAGLPAPVPLAAGEADAGFRRRSFVALAAIPGTPLERLDPPTVPAARRRLVRAVAELVRAFHAAGFWHRDLYLANLILDEPSRAAPEEPRLGLVDLERVRRRAGGPPERWRVKDLAALDSSSPRWAATDRVRFLRVYLARPRLGPDGRALARRVRAKARALLRQGAKG